MQSLLEPLSLARGPAMKNRFMLAPLTNCQSHPDGRLSDEEFHWLTMRARGGFGLVMTCAAHVQPRGQGFAGQLGAFSDEHLPGLRRLAAAIKAQGAVSSVQLHHAGFQAPAALIGETPVAPSESPERGARALTTGEVEQVAEDFIAAAVRADQAGFDGVELHGAHSYLICAFLSREANRRTDRYGGSPENRARLLREIIAGVRARCRADFQLGVRLSAERFGVDTAEIRALAEDLMTGGELDYLDMSLWDVFKTAEDEAFKSRRLIDLFADLPRGRTRLGAAGKVTTAQDCRRLMEAGADFVVLGRAGILHHDYPQRFAADPHFRPLATPASPAHLAAEGVSPKFLAYLGSFKGFVAEEEPAEA
jgi:2,4-dienoyl-CoA reductase-like NADH-dependent reductase (Old Yellow Enzyme family)